MGKVEEIVERIQDGETSLYPELWEAVRPFIAQMAKQRYDHVQDRGGVDCDDLVQSGYFGLVKAVETYEPGKAGFLTHLTYHLKGPFNAACGCSWERTMRDPIHRALSLDAPVSDDPKGPTLMDTLKELEDPSDIVHDRDEQERLREAEERLISRLPEAAADIVRAKYLNNEPSSVTAERHNMSVKKLSSRRSSYLLRLQSLARTAPEGADLRQYVEDRSNYYRKIGPSEFNRTHTSVPEFLTLRREYLVERYRRFQS